MLDALKHINTITNVSKLRSFQFRLLQGIIFCNDVLFHWKLKESQQCDWCIHPKQNVVHLLIQRPQVANLWRFVEFILQCSKIEYRLSTVELICNKVTNAWRSCANFIVLITKFYIYRCKVQNVKPTVKKLTQELDLWYQVEGHIASITGKFVKHNKKWSPVTHHNG